MRTSLYDLSVPTFLQTVRAVGGFLDRAAKHCAETGADPDDFVHARLFDAKGRMVAQGPYSPGHMGAMSFAVKNALTAHPVETLRPG